MAFLESAALHPLSEYCMWFRERFNRAYVLVYLGCITSVAKVQLNSHS